MNSLTTESSVWRRQFFTEHFVSRGMIVDFAVHEPEKEEGGINNPHFHFLCPIRPIEPNGKWGYKQRREYVWDENGNRIPDGKGDHVFNAVPTTDWSSADTLEFWREQWAVMCNAKFEEKGLDVRIDHRSYERQGMELLPTIHEGPTVRAMEKKGIKTEKGDFNRWIKSTNAFIRNLRNSSAVLLEAIKEIKAEMKQPQAESVIVPLQRYFDMRNAKAYSQKARVSNLKEFNKLSNYLLENKIYTIEELEARVEAMRNEVDALKATLDNETQRMKEIRKMPEYSATYKQLKPVFDGLQKIKFDKCPGHFIRESVLERMVLKHIQLVTEHILTHRQHFIAVMERQLHLESQEKLQVSRKQLERNERRISELKRLFVKIYEDNARGKLSDERFDMMSQGHEAEQKQLEGEVVALRQEIKVQERQNENIEKFIRKADKYVGIEEIDPYMLRELTMWSPRTSPAANADRISISSTMASASSLWTN